MKSMWFLVAAALLAADGVVCLASAASDGSTVTVESGVAPAAGQLPEGNVEALIPPCPGDRCREAKTSPSLQRSIVSAGAGLS